MIELLTANTPNGKKISIMLEEIKFKYKVTKINIGMVNTGSITDTVFQAILSSVNGQNSNVPYVVKESMIPCVAYPKNEKK